MGGVEGFRRQSYARSELTEIVMPRRDPRAQGLIERGGGSGGLQRAERPESDVDRTKSLCPSGFVGIGGSEGDRDASAAVKQMCLQLEPTRVRHLQNEYQRLRLGTATAE